MYEILTHFRMAEAEEIIDALRQIADEIEQGYDGGTTPIGEWAIVEHAYAAED